MVPNDTLHLSPLCLVSPNRCGHGLPVCICYLLPRSTSFQTSAESTAVITRKEHLVFLVLTSISQTALPFPPRDRILQLSPNSCPVLTKALRTRVGTLDNDLLLYNR